jgi:organic radical activating enzyme
MKSNIQKVDSFEKLTVMESFYTLQGEGSFAGRPAFFIRIGGCDVGCHWCDVKESWDATLHPEVDLEDLILQANDCKTEIVVVTGGEPLMYDLTPLTRMLRDTGKRAHLETAGVYPITGQWDWICFSPKKFKEPLNEFYEKSHELKVVIFNKSDLAWAEGHAQRMNGGAKLFLQPEWEKQKQMMPLIVDYVKENPRWSVSLQSHKFMDIP